MHGCRLLNPTLVSLNFNLESIINNPRGKSNSNDSISSMEEHNDDHVEDLGYIDQ